MRKWLSLLAAGALCAGVLSACTAEGKTGQLLRTASGGLQTSARLYEQEYRSADGETVLGRYSYEVPVMTGTADDASSANVSGAFNDGISVWLETEQAAWDETMEDAESYYNAYGSDIWASNGVQWVSEVHYTANQMDRLLCVRYEHYVYTGGAHGYTYYSSQMFALQSGDFVTLEEMTDDPGGLSQAVTEEILHQIKENDIAVQYGYWSDYDTFVAGWMDGDGAYFTEDGSLQIIFPAYELASYAAGPQEFLVPQEVYEPYLNDYGKVLLNLY